MNDDSSASQYYFAKNQQRCRQKDWASISSLAGNQRVGRKNTEENKTRYSTQGALIGLSESGQDFWELAPEGV